jgi:hypothetical protein
MGPATGTPFYFLLMIASLALAILLWLGEWRTTALVTSTAGTGLFVLHRACVWIYRRQHRRESIKR